MVDRNNSTGGDSSSGRTRLEIGGPIGLREVILVLMAGSLGVGGNLAIVGTNPNARADPFTGAMGREMGSRITKLERGQALDDQHRIDAVSGYARMRSIEQRCVLNESGVKELRGDYASLRENLREIERELRVIGRDLGH